MSNENAELIRRAYQAYASGDLAAMLELVDPDLEWTYLDPILEHPTPQVCRGRHELERMLRGWAEHGLRAELEEVTGSGELVMVGVRTPEVDAQHGWRRGDRAYSMFTMRHGRIVALRDCRDRQEAVRGDLRRPGLRLLPALRPRRHLGATPPRPVSSGATVISDSDRLANSAAVLLR
jgi:ketosteroid isomerase-like protein